MGGMGAEVDQTTFTREDRKQHRAKVRKGLDVLARMLTESRFDFERPMAGLEIELNLVDDEFEPAMRNAEVLAAIADPYFVTELGRFNIEINVPPRRLNESGFTVFEEFVRRGLSGADPAAAQRVGLHALRGVRPAGAERGRPPRPRPGRRADRDGGHPADPATRARA